MLRENNELTSNNGANPHPIFCFCFLSSVSQLRESLFPVSHLNSVYVAYNEVRVSIVLAQKFRIFCNIYGKTQMNILVNPISNHSSTPKILIYNWALLLLTGPRPEPVFLLHPYGF